MNRRNFLLSSFGLASIVDDVYAIDVKWQTALVLDDDFKRHHISAAHPESPARYTAMTQQFNQQVWGKRLHLLTPWSLKQTEPWLTTIHSDEHLNSLKQQSSQTYQQVLLATGACLAAVDAVLSGQVRNAFCPSRPPGHHALNTGKEEGFCYVNHVAIAARYAQQQYDLSRVLIIDWDYHHGNGTEWAFYDDPSVLFFSTHDEFAYPGTGNPERKGIGAGQGFNINVHLDCGSTEKDVMNAFEQKLMPVLADFQPELILISAGFDSREDDVLGCFNISDEGFVKLTRWVMQLADETCEGRVVSVLEGGYNIQGNAKAALAHLKALSGMSDS